MNEDWKVYVHTNKINGKRYVGITSKPKVEHRWNEGRGYSKNPRFYSAIKCYGWDGFEHDVLLTGLTKDEAITAECALIERWKTNDLKYGYNMTTGGDGTCGYHPSNDTRQKLSELRRKENLSEETLSRRSAGLKGRKFTDEHKRKIGVGNSKPVMMLSKDGKYIRSFSSAHEVEISLGVSHTHISQCCHNKRKGAGGYLWKFAQ